MRDGTYLVFLLSESTVLVVTLRVWFHGPAGEEVTHGIVANVLRHLAKLEEIPRKGREGGREEGGEKREEGEKDGDRRERRGEERESRRGRREGKRKGGREEGERGRGREEGERRGGEEGELT